MPSYQGRFYPLALLTEFPFSSGTIEAALKFSSPGREYLPFASDLSFEISASVVHESIHFLYYMSHSSCICAHFIEHQLYGRKLEILKQYGTRHYADDLQLFYRNSDIKDPALWAEYQTLDHELAIFDVLTNLGTYPLTKIKSYNRMVHRDAHKITFGRWQPASFLPTIAMPTEQELGDAKDLPTLDDLVESVAMVEEVAFVKRSANSAAISRQADKMLEKYLGLSRYSAAYKTVLKHTQFDLTSAVPIAIMSLALSGRAITVEEEEVRWSEFSPAARLATMLRLSDQIPISWRKIGLIDGDANEVFANLDEFFSRRARWHSARANTRDALRNVERIRSAFRGQLNMLPLSRMAECLRAKLDVPAFPHRVPFVEFRTHSPIYLFTNGLKVTQCTPEENEHVLSYIRIVLMQMAVRYLISRNDTNSHDEEFARRVYREGRRYIVDHVDRSALDQALAELPEDYDRFVSTIVHASADE